MIEADHITRDFRTRAGVLSVLHGVDLAVDPGELVVIQGASGSGKTTLLMSIGGLRRPTSGTVRVDGNDLYAVNGARRARIRAESIGFVFQVAHLLPYLDVVENVRAGARDIGEDAARTWLERVGLADRAHHRADELSVGERQRVALARALSREPRVILADEATGNLDRDAAAGVFDVLDGARQRGAAIIVVTHHAHDGLQADRLLELVDGRLDSAA